MLGNYRKKVLGNDHIDTLHAQRKVSVILIENGQLQVAKQVLESILRSVNFEACDTHVQREIAKIKTVQQELLSRNTTQDRILNQKIQETLSNN